MNSIIDGFDSISTQDEKKLIQGIETLRSPVI